MTQSLEPATRLGFGGSQPVRRADDRRKRLGVYSKILDRGALGLAIDPHTREGRFIVSYEKMLVEHIGGQPTVTQKMLITRAARIALHLELLDTSVFKARQSLSQHSLTHYVAWSNALTRMLTNLGLEPPSGGQAPRLDDYLKAKTQDPAQPASPRP